MPIINTKTANLCSNNWVLDFVEVSNMLFSKLNFVSGNKAETFLGGIGTDVCCDVVSSQLFMLSFCCPANRASKETNVFEEIAIIQLISFEVQQTSKVEI